MGAINEKRIEAIKERMQHTGGNFIDDNRALDFIQRTEQAAQEQIKHQTLLDEQKKAERKKKERDTKAYLDLQVAAKHDRKEMEKLSENKHAQVV